MPRPRQWLWFAGLWLGGVAVTGAVAYVLRLWINSFAGTAGS